MTERTFESLTGPRGWPLIGNFRDRARRVLDFFSSLTKYGDAARFTIFSERFIFFSDPAAANEIFVTKAASFKKGRAIESLRWFLGNGLLTSEEPDHAPQRRLIQPAFHRGRIAGYAQTMARQTQVWSNAQKAGTTIDLAVAMNRLTLAIVVETLFGTSIDEQTTEISAALTEIMRHFHRMLLPYWSLVRRLPLSSNRRLLEARAKLDATIAELIARRRAAAANGDAKHDDLLSMLLAAEDAEAPHHRLTDAEVRDQALTIFTAGHETTANAMTWTWYLLGRHESVRRRLVEEVNRVLGPERLPSLDDVPQLVYTRAVFAESLRLYPPVYGIARRALEEVVIGDIRVAPGILTLISPYTMHRDPRFWPDPEAFLPERWLDEAATLRRPKYAYCPFGGGSRVCIGDAFAWTEGVICLAIIARRWRFELLVDQLATDPLLTLRPKGGLPVRVHDEALPTKLVSAN